MSKIKKQYLDFEIYEQFEVDTISGSLSVEIDSDISTHAALGDVHHSEIHSIASHSDTSATGAELNTLTDNSIADTLHRHSELVAPDGSPDPALSVNNDGGLSTHGWIEHGGLGSGNRYSVIDFIGDDTYTDYGLRIIRNSTGANAVSQILHRGTGNLQIRTQDAAAIILGTSSATRLTIASDGHVWMANGLVFHTDEVRARDSGGLYLRDDAGNLGIHVADGAGSVRILDSQLVGYNLQINNYGSGNRYAIIDLIGDDTYTGFGFRIIRNNSGINTESDLIHRGTGNFRIRTQDAAAITLDTNNATRLTIASDGHVWMANGTGINEFSTDGTLAGNSDDAVPTEKAVRTAIGTKSDNILINQDFSIWQENTTFSNPATDVYTADGWYVKKSTTNAPTINIKENTSVHENDFAQTVELEITNVGSISSGRFWTFEQKIEDYEKYRGKTITLSIRIKASTTINLNGGLLYIYDGAGATTPITSVTTTWTTYSVTRTISSSATLIRCMFCPLAWGAAHTISTTGSIYIQWMKLEVGSVNTPLIPRRTGDDLALCQRYYQKSYAQGTFAGTNTETGSVKRYFNSVNNSSHRMDTDVRLPVVMKAAPTVTIYHTGGTINQVKMGSGGYTANITDITESSFIVWGNNTGTITNRLLQFHYIAVSRP